MIVPSEDVRYKKVSCNGNLLCAKHVVFDGSCWIPNAHGKKICDGCWNDYCDLHTCGD